MRFHRVAALFGFSRLDNGERRSMAVAARHCGTSMRNILYAVQQCLFFVSVVLFAVGSSVGSLDIALAAVLVLYSSNLVFGFLRIRERLLFSSFGYCAVFAYTTGYRLPRSGTHMVPRNAGGNDVRTCVSVCVACLSALGSGSGGLFGCMEPCGEG